MKISKWLMFGLMLGMVGTAFAAQRVVVCESAYAEY